MKRTVALAILAALLLTLCACGKVRQAEEAIDAIGNVTAESGAQIEAAEAAVEALNDKQRDKLPNLTVLEEAQTEYETVLEEQAETEACVQEAENAIDAIGSVTLDSGDAIRAARAAYDAVPEEAREQVTNRETLSAAEQTFDALAIQATTDAINAIGDVTLDSGEAIRAARELYDGFSGAIQSQVANRDVLVRDEEQFSALRVQHVNDLITDIGEVTLSSEDRIREAEDAYNALSESEAAAVTNHRVLVEAREAFDTMEAAARLQVAIDDARSRLRVTRLEVKPLEAGGAELHFSFVNESEQTIHYVYYGVTFYDAEGTVWDVLCRETDHMHLVPDDPCYCSVTFLDEEYKERDVLIEASKTVRGRYPDTEHVRFRTLPPVTYAGCVYRGSYAQISDVIAAVAAWVAANGYESAGPMFNIYHVSPHETQNPDEFVTEVCFPVREA